MCVASGRTLFLLKLSLRDDDDEFLYGDSQLKVSADLAVAAPVPSSAGENTSSPPCTCILLRRVLYPTRPQTKYKFDILAHSSFSCVRVQLQLQLLPLPLPQRQQPQCQLNRMSEFHQQLFNRARAHLSHQFFFFWPFSPFISIPFGKTVPADDDLFPPIRPPADVTAMQADDAEEGEDFATADADADADVVTGDGTDASEESDEVSSSVQK